jgi:hypothetical protein
MFPTRVRQSNSVNGFFVIRIRLNHTGPFARCSTVYKIDFHVAAQFGKVFFLIPQGICLCFCFLLLPRACAPLPSALSLR